MHRQHWWWSPRASADVPVPDTAHLFPPGTSVRLPLLPADAWRSIADYAEHPALPTVCRGLWHVLHHRHVQLIRSLDSVTFRWIANIEQYLHGLDVVASAEAGRRPVHWVGLLAACPRLRRLRVRRLRHGPSPTE